MYPHGMAADRIRLAEPAPPHCSGCFQQKPQQPHVDFGAAYDGPTVPALENTVGVVGHTIDDLILCEDCLRTAAGLIGLCDPGAVVAERDQLEASLGELHLRIRGLEDYNAKLQQAVAAKPDADREAMREAPRRKPKAGVK